MKSLCGFLVLAILGFVSGQVIFPRDDIGPTQNTFSFGRCLSARGGIGECLYINDCPEFAALSRKRPLRPGDLNILRENSCGFFNRSPLVCCLDNRPATQAPPPSARPPTQTYQPPPTQPHQPQQPVDPGLGSRSGLLPQPGVCGSGVSDRIIGGNITRIGEYPWMTLLTYTKPGGKTGFHCGGALINERYVLTASHCVNGKAIPKDWVLSHVRLGEYDIKTEQDCYLDDCVGPEAVLDVPIEKHIPHENYDPASKNQYHDIALLRLSQPVKYNSFIKPICLPTNPQLRSADFVGNSLEVAGWGRTETAGQSNVKLKAQVGGVALEPCNKVYEKYSVTLQDTQLCAGGERGIDSCSGDSGGPLMATAAIPTGPYRLPYFYCAGIVSFGPSPCAQEGWPGVYTKVSSYVDWIERNVLP